MPKKGKGKAKNTVNKAKHSKLKKKKKDKLKEKKDLHALRLKQLHAKRKEIESQKENNAS